MSNDNASLEPTRDNWGDSSISKEWKRFWCCCFLTEGIKVFVCFLLGMVGTGVGGFVLPYALYSGFGICGCFLAVVLGIFVIFLILIACVLCCIPSLIPLCGLIFPIFFVILCFVLICGMIVLCCFFIICFPLFGIITGCVITFTLCPLSGCCILLCPNPSLVMCIKLCGFCDIEDDEEHGEKENEEENNENEENIDSISNDDNNNNNNNNIREEEVEIPVEIRNSENENLVEIIFPEDGTSANTNSNNNNNINEEIIEESESPLEGEEKRVSLKKQRIGEKMSVFEEENAIEYFSDSTESFRPVMNNENNNNNNSNNGTQNDEEELNNLDTEYLKTVSIPSRNFSSSSASSTGSLSSSYEEETTTFKEIKNQSRKKKKIKKKEEEEGEGENDSSDDEIISKLGASIPQSIVESEFKELEIVTLENIIIPTVPKKDEEKEPTPKKKEEEEEDVNFLNIITNIKADDIKLEENNEKENINL